MSIAAAHESRSRRLGLDTAYLLAGFPVAAAGFVAVVPLFFAGIGTLITLIGWPILVAVCWIARGFANAERALLPMVLRGRELHRPAYRPATGRVGIRWFLNPLTQGQSWLDVLHAFVVFILSAVTFPLTIAWWAVAIGGTTAPLWLWIPPTGPDNTDLPELIGLGDSYPVRAVFYLVVGLIFAMTLRYVVRALALTRAGVGRGLLLRSTVTELRERVSALTESRAAVVSAEASALRKLERDIHDGPQQRLVRLAMDLGVAAHRLDTEPESAKPLVLDAIDQTTQTLEELRALSRGIAPPVLADRGLATALAAVAGRCPVPVELDVSVPDRLPAAVETTAYFVVTEALTNVAKHSGASTCSVRVRQDGSVLSVLVSDNGVGGAQQHPGHGIEGLADRVRGLDGVFSLDSAPGGPTVIVAELPCG